jgi:hypothetical protein
MAGILGRFLWLPKSTDGSRKGLLHTFALRVVSDESSLQINSALLDFWVIVCKAVYPLY